MTARFTDKSVIITGAGGGLGQATAIRLAPEGASQTLVDLNLEGLETTKKLILDATPEARVELVTADVMAPSDVTRYVETAISTFGTIHGFFNNAGIEGKHDLIEDYTLEAFSKVITVNLNGVFLGLESVLKTMRQNGYGRIVNTASVAGIRGIGNMSGYVASKHGVIGLTRNSAREYSQFGITVNAIEPGPIMTDLGKSALRQVNPADLEDASRQMLGNNPAKRFGEPHEVADVVAFLLSDEASYINAAVIPIDGGQSAMI